MKRPSTQLQQDILNGRIVTFLEARIAEIEGDPDWQVRCNEAINDRVEMVDCSSFGTLPGTILVRGAVRDMSTLKRLVRNWADHPDFLPEWETP